MDRHPSIFRRLGDRASLLEASTQLAGAGADRAGRHRELGASQSAENSPWRAATPRLAERVSPRGAEFTTAKPAEPASSTDQGDDEHAP
jgi:hypothetical protein